MNCGLCWFNSLKAAPRPPIVSKSKPDFKSRDSRAFNPLSRTEKTTRGGEKTSAKWSPSPPITTTDISSSSSSTKMEVVASMLQRMFYTSSAGLDRCKLMANRIDQSGLISQTCRDDTNHVSVLNPPSTHSLHIHMFTCAECMQKVCLHEGHKQQKTSEVRGCSSGSVFRTWYTCKIRCGGFSFKPLPKSSDLKPTLWTLISGDGRQLSGKGMATHDICGEPCASSSADCTRNGTEELTRICLGSRTGHIVQQV